MKIDSKAQYEKLMKEEYAVIDFYAEWCGPCRMLGPVVEEVSSQHPEFNLYKIDIDVLPEIAEKHNVQSVPTIIYFKNGQEVDRSNGFLAGSVLTDRIQKNRA